MKLDFAPLDRLPWIMNAVVPINEHVQLSVSYGNGKWYVGEIDSYEAALQIIDSVKYPGIASLVSFESNPASNIWHKCNEEKLLELIKLGKELKYSGSIEIFDRPLGKDDTAEKEWNIRFLCAEGFDEKGKLEYCKRIWGPKECRFIPYLVDKKETD